AERISGIGMTKSVGAVQVPHVPEVGADRLGHAHAVSCIAERGSRQHGEELPVLTLHVGGRLETAASEDDCTRSADRATRALILDLDPGNAAAVADQAPGRAR